LSSLFCVPNYLTLLQWILLDIFFVIHVFICMSLVEFFMH
jgi:hypothetical protein